MNYLVGLNDLIKDKITKEGLEELITRLFIARPKLNGNEHNTESKF
jgi:hypothetical protein